MESSSYILWLGGVFDEKTVASYPAVSPAANQWQKGLLRALSDIGEQVEVLGHLPEPLWPKGRLRIEETCVTLTPGINGNVIGYWNMPLIRTSDLSRKYIKAFKKLCRDIGKPIVVISYNVYPHSGAVGLFAQQELGIPWVCIVADAPPTEPEPNMSEHENWLKKAAGRVFLSWSWYESCQTHPAIHLDGGISYVSCTLDTASALKTSQSPIVLYTGSLGKHGGVSYLVQAFKLVKNQNIHLWICGKGTNKELRCAVMNDNRIKFWGFVDEVQLQNLLRRANIFVNPRPTYIKANMYNFPSKILEYLSYGKPVISTWTAGLCPEYRNVLIVLSEETLECLASTIENVASWRDEKYTELCSRISLFMNSRKLWSIQARRLMQWLKFEII